MFQPNGSSKRDSRKPEFVHEIANAQASSRSEKLVTSTCILCKAYVGASSNPELLARVETLHQCSKTLPIAAA
jgi:hypothetical protein